MQVKLTIENDLLKLIPQLNSINPKQASFAIANALTQTAKVVQKEIKSEMSKVFDRPTPYTLNSLFVRSATKSRLQADVRVKDDAGKSLAPIKWLNAEIYGGPRNLKRSEVLLRTFGILPQGMFIVPGAGLNLDNSGNVSSGQMQKILSQLKSNFDSYANESIASKKRKAKRAQPDARYFVVQPGSNNTNLKPGIYARYGFASGSSIKPIFLFVRSPQYKQRLPFFEIGQKVIQAHLLEELSKSYELTLKTAKSSPKL